MWLFFQWVISGFFCGCTEISFVVYWTIFTIGCCRLICIFLHICQIVELITQQWKSGFDSSSVRLKKKTKQKLKWINPDILEVNILGQNTKI